MKQGELFDFFDILPGYVTDRTIIIATPLCCCGHEKERHIGKMFSEHCQGCDCLQYRANRKYKVGGR